jgi:ElaB/YqjD/DUF883 family membrane-anchored ribosome-binding protein
MGTTGERRRREPAEIRADIESARAEIADSLLTLRSQVRKSVDWRERVRRQPLVALGVAFSVGFLLGWRKGDRE